MLDSTVIIENSDTDGPWIPGAVTVSGPLNFVTIEQLVDLLYDDKEVEILDLSKTNYIDYIAMHTLKDFLSHDDEPTQDTDDDQSHDQLNENDDVINEPAIKVILPINCPDAFQKFLVDANLSIVDHHIE